jgi:hypothetical protein
MKYDGSRDLPNNREIWLDSKSLLKNIYQK